MGLFAPRPQEPFEWAGLPSEPLEPESDAEHLGDPVAVDPAGLAGSGFGSIVIPVEAPADAGDGAADGDERAEGPRPDRDPTGD